MKSLVSGLSVSHSCPHPTARNIICRTGTYERTNFSTGQLIYEAAILFNGFSYGPIFLSLFALILAAKFLCLLNVNLMMSYRVRFYLFYPAGEKLNFFFNLRLR